MVLGANYGVIPGATAHESNKNIQCYYFCDGRCNIFTTVLQNAIAFFQYSTHQAKEMLNQRFDIAVLAESRCNSIDSIFIWRSLVVEIHFDSHFILWYTSLF